MIDPNSTTQHFRRALLRPATQIQPCGKCPACAAKKPRECVRLLGAENDASKQPELVESVKRDWPDAQNYMGTCRTCRGSFKGEKGRTKGKVCWACAGWPDIHVKPNRDLSDPAAQPNPECGCRACNPTAWWMVVCKICGNKRCSHAEDHRFECSGSNAVGQTPKIGPPRAQEPNVGTFVPATVSNSGNEPLLAFFVSCDPTASTAQQKGVRIVNGKPMFFTKAKVKKAEQQIARLFAPYAPPVPFTGPLAVEVEFSYPWRKGEAKSVRGHWKCRPKDTKPDVENAFKSVGDQMTKLNFWSDDSQISRLVLVKAWTDEPGIRVKIRRCNPVPR